jgi:hypothetical protein
MWSTREQHRVLVGQTAGRDPELDPLLGPWAGTSSAAGPLAWDTKDPVAPERTGVLGRR